MDGFGRQTWLFVIDGRRMNKDRPPYGRIRAMGN